jgi:hypothetical protein
MREDGMEATQGATTGMDLGCAVVQDANRLGGNSL